MRMGATLLLTHNIETLGRMSCNPSIGGIGRAIWSRSRARGAVRFTADEANQSHPEFEQGGAVRATRAQADRVFTSRQFARASKTRRT